MNTSAPLDRPDEGVTAAVPQHVGQSGEAVWIAGLTVLAAVLSFWAIGSKSLWRDEGFGVSTSLRPWGALWDLTIDKDTNGALYNFALRAWSQLGTSEGILRSLSAVFTVAAVPAAYLLGRRLLATRRAALIAATILAFHGSALTYAQQIRPYSLSILLAIAATAAFVADVEAPRRWTLATWVGALVLLAHSHLFALTLALAHLASLWVVAPAQRRLTRRLGGAAVAGTACLPLIILIGSHEEGQGLFSLRPGVFRDVLVVMSGRGGIPGFAAFGLLAVLAVRQSSGRWRASAPRGAQSDLAQFRHFVLVSWAVVPPALMLAASLIQPMVIGRYLLFTLPALTLWGASALDEVLATRRRRATAAILAVVIGLGFARGASYWLADGGTEDWRAAARIVFAEAEPRDGAVFANDSVRLFFDYYRTRIGESPNANPVPEFPAQPWGRFGTGDQTYESFTPADIRRIGAKHNRLWVVVGRNHDNVDGVPAALDALGDTHTRQSQRDIGDIRISVWVRDGQGS